MAKSLNLALPKTLREFVDAQAGDGGLYATPSEYVRELIRRDMAGRELVGHVREGLDDLRQGRLSDKSILDIHDEA